MLATPGSDAVRAPRAPWHRQRVGWAIWIVCGAYFVLQCVYVLNLPLVMDEYAGAYQVHMLREGIPYRDYMPYKTVLGYYLQLPFFVASSDPWWAMLSVKLGMAGVTGLVCGCLAQRLRRRWRGGAVLLGLVLLLAHSTFLERASELRVDTLTALCGWCGLVALLEGRLLRSGIWVGLSLLVSQKGALFAVSTLVALLYETICGPQPWRGCVWSSLRQCLSRCLRFGLPVAVLLSGYGLLFGVIAGFGRVFERVAVSPGQVAFTEMYELRHFWWQTLERNPTFYGLAAASALTLLGRRVLRGPDADGDRLLGYALSLTVLCAWYKQPWPYFFVLLLPTLTLLSMAGLNAWRVGLAQLGAREGGKRAARWMLAGGAVGLLLLGVALPLRRVPRVLERDQGYQRRTIAAAYALAGERDAPYFAGTPLLWLLPHVPGTSWLDQRRVAQLAHDPSLALYPLSLSPPKLAVFTYRYGHLPEQVRAWFAERYEPVGGSLLALRTPISPGVGEITIPYAGLHRLFGDGPITIDGRVHEPGSTMTLAAGRHRVESRIGGRLVPWSDEPAFAQYAFSSPERFFYNLYHY